MHQPLEIEECKICGKQFDKTSEKINLCEYKEGFVHLDCCKRNCSWDGEPCKHSINIYVRV